ncbi:hypothetical protein MMC11_008770 [Xylographa trunciseda]|nr:hypothetical protein [Xylographa trunciseda]
MSFNTFYITIKNGSTDPARFMLFLEPPKADPSSPTQFSNIWQTSPRIDPGNSSVSFKLTDEYFAILGTSLEPMAKGVRPWTSSSYPVNLGPPHGTMAYVTSPEDSPKWAEVEEASAPGSFIIKCDDSFKTPNPNNIWIGMGARDPRHPTSIIPVITMTAQPSFTSQFYPKRKFYVTVGESKKGTVVESEKNEHVLMVDFGASAGPESEAVFTFTNEHTYEPDEATKRSGIIWQS